VRGLVNETVEHVIIIIINCHKYTKERMRLETGLEKKKIDLK